MIEISPGKRRAAHNVWKRAFARLGIASVNVGQAFRKRWSECAECLSDELVVVGDMLWGLSNSLTEKSVPIFHDKIRAILKCRTEDEYFGCVSELEVPALLAPRISPIAFEPLVPQAANPAAKPPSADHSVVLPSGETFVEATSIDLRSLTDNGIQRCLRSKLKKKRRQLPRGRVSLIGLKVSAQVEALKSVSECFNRHIWKSNDYRRFSGVLAFCEKSNEIGAFVGVWLPNPRSIAPPPTDLTELICGRRCLHLHRARTLECSTLELTDFRHRVSKQDSFSFSDGVAVRAQLSGGPLDNLSAVVESGRLGCRLITYSWDLRSDAKAGHKTLAMPPHGPLQVVYERRDDQHYVFTGIRFWINELRPSIKGAQYLPRLELTESSS